MSHSLSRSDGETQGSNTSETYDPEDEEQEASSASRGSSQSRSRTSSRGSSTGTSRATSRSSSRSTATSHATSHGVTTSESISRGRGQTFKSVLEERATQTWSLDEQRYLNAASIRNMPQRHAILKTPTAPALRFTVDTVKTPITTPARIRAFNAHALARSPYTRPLPEIESELQVRQSQLVERIALTATPEEPVTFREKKRTRPKVIDH